jgi:hypothetical protein
MIDFMAGKRTYVLAFGAVVAAGVAFFTGEMTLAEAINAALVGAGLGTLRAGMR